MGENVDGGKMRKIYMGGALSLSNATGDNVFFFDIRKIIFFTFYRRLHFRPLHASSMFICSKVVTIINKI